MAKKGTKKKRQMQPESGVSAGAMKKILIGAVAVVLLLTAVVWPTVSRMLERMSVSRTEGAVIAALNEQAKLAATVTDTDSATAVANDFGASQADLLAALESLKSVRASWSLAAEELTERVDRFESDYEKAEQPLRSAELKMSPDARAALRKEIDGKVENRLAEVRAELLPKRQAAEIAQKEREAGFLAEVERQKGAGGQQLGGGRLGLGGNPPPAAPAIQKPAAPANDPTIGTIPGGQFIGLGASKPAEAPLDRVPESDFLKEHAGHAVTVTVLGVDAKSAPVTEKLTTRIGEALQATNVKGQPGEAGRFHLFVELDDFDATSKLSDIGEIVKSFPEKRVVVLKVDPTKL